ncbi:MAG: NADH-quinone oxidoreductase subunit H, partial [candidate division NC10 bacterium]|nr:NADH-quinone oxidoreductase subunit H [candidate division NC10 bacterium]
MVEFVIIMLVKIGVVFVGLLLTVAYLTWLERKILADIQVRIGPYRVGPYGLLQPIADVIKLLFKEDIIPANADRAIYILAPSIALIPALISFAVIPFGPQVQLFGRTIDLYITDINVGLLYIFAVSSLGVYGIVLAGWSS